MASYGLLKGVGGALQKTADDIGEKLKQDRIQAYQQKLQEQTWERQDTMRAEDRQWQTEDKAEDREFRQAEKAEDRTYQEGILQKGWSREDQIRNEGYSRDDAKESRMESQAAYTDTATKDGKQFKVFFDKAGKEIGRSELGDATTSTTKTYLDPAVQSRLNSLDKEISSLQRADLEYDNTGKSERLQSLIQERDGIQNQLMGKGESAPKPKPQIIPVGHVEDSYKFTGGNPNDPNAWVKVK